MTVYIKINLPTSNEPQPQWLNQVMVTLAMGKRYEQKQDFEKAAVYYETVLYYNPKDTSTRIKLSKCYQKTLQLERAVKHQKLAMQKDPYSFQTSLNESSINFELGNFENSLIGYIRCFKRWKLSSDCNKGLIKINQMMENSFPIDGIINCLGGTILKMIEDDKFFNESTDDSQLFKKTNKLNKLREANIEQVSDTNYLPYSIKENVEFYKKKMSDLPKGNLRDRLISEQMQEIVHTYKKVKNELYQQLPLYMIPCQRPNYRLNDRQKAKNAIKSQISKYVNTVIEHCLAGKIRLAREQAELAMSYMNKWRYKPLETVNTLYEVLGIALYLLNQDVPKWSDELNEKRILYLLGSNTQESDSYVRLYQESYFGSNYVDDTKNTVKKLSRQIKKTELSTYKLYLQYERIKCYMASYDVNETRPLSQQMFADARALGSIVWQANSLMLSIIFESRLCNSMICMETLEFIIPISRTLGNKNVTEFMRKIWKLFAEDRVKVHKIGFDEIRRANLVDIMPDSNTASYMRKLLHSIVQLPQS